MGQKLASENIRREKRRSFMIEKKREVRLPFIGFRHYIE